MAKRRTLPLASLDQGFEGARVARLGKGHQAGGCLQDQHATLQAPSLPLLAPPKRSMLPLRAGHIVRSVMVYRSRGKMLARLRTDPLLRAYP